MGAATWTLQIISTSCFRAHPRQSRSQLKKKKTTKGWIEMGHSQLHLQNKFEWYLPCENQFYLHEKKSNIFLTKNSNWHSFWKTWANCVRWWLQGELGRAFGFPLTQFVFNDFFSEKMERMETSLRAPAGVGQGVHGGSLPPTNRWVIC